MITLALPSRRIEALRGGVTQYFTGKPCHVGHVCARRASSGDCLECDRIKKRAFKKDHRDIWNAQTRQYRADNPERSRGWSQAFRARNPERAAAIVKKYRDANREIHNAIEARRRAAKRLRSPGWADVAAMKTVYELAAATTSATGVLHEVDHIIPLCGANVSGLHVGNNLQIITWRRNRSKGNRFDPGAACATLE